LVCKQHDATEETKAYPIEKQIEEQFSDYYGWGEIIEILTPGANDVWVIKGQNGKEILIPYIEDVVKKIDIENKKIDIEVMEGLID